MDESFRMLLPDMSAPSLSEQLNIGGEQLTVEVSSIHQYPDYGLDVDVVHVWALRDDGLPVALRDLRPDATAEEAFNLWSYLCEQVSVAASLVYGLRQNPEGIPNPKLGCWGPRPDLARTDADDSATALVLGVAIDIRDASRTPREDLLILAVRSAVVVSLRHWVGAD